ncbi:PQQ-binding-like beta-propeller repeat protein [Frankia sp. AgB32]|uniref:outer membrane protein assembly factor BamB family protein n=1 Tax=Frankia sp. AgB32 TaxID=631119 RepID=UPI00200FD0D8|nr:PQQ-binding-like beta-propeller repeat protein [Frankia sp. AgB32]MCK9895300.1 PQQ-like beta-propeller repeat protein [Frankia sp. AgB32]
MRHTTRLLTAATSLLFLLAACGSGSGPLIPDLPATSASAGGPATKTLPPARNYDPPVHFSQTGAVPMPPETGQGLIGLDGSARRPLPVVLVGTLAYIAATDRLLAVDTRTGQQLDSPITPRSGQSEPYQPSGFVGDNPAQRPLSTTVGGHRRLYTAFVVDMPGSGTTPKQPALELVGVEVPGLRAAARAVVPLEKWVSEPPYGVVAAPVFSDEHTVVVRVTDDSSDATTYAIDATSGKVLWKQDDFAARAVVGSTVVGELPGESYPAKTSGLSLSDGSIRWTKSDEARSVTILPGGPTTVVAYGETAGRANFLNLIDPATGAVLDSSSGAVSDVTCEYDGTSVTVCSQPAVYGDAWAAAFDATTHAWLWSLPDDKANRVAPTVTTVWHGAVYGYTRSGPVILDARTGADRATAPGTAPFVVDGDVGIADTPDTSGVLAAYPADG